MENVVIYRVINSPYKPNIIIVMRQLATLFLMLLILPAYSNGQISIATNPLANPTPLYGQTQLVQTFNANIRSGVADTTLIRNIINQTGANQTWTLTGLQYGAGVPTNIRYSAPTGAPGASSFPTANLVSRVVTGQDTAVWSFSNTAADRFTSLGSVIGRLSTNTAFTNSISTFNPGLDGLRFPLNNTSAWTQTSQTLTFELVSAGITTPVPFTYDFRVDGFGSVVTPAGTAQVLRLRQTASATISLAGIPISTTAINLLFINQNGQALASIIETRLGLPPGLPIQTPPPFSASYSTYGALSVRELAVPRPTDFSLEQNYPNPFNPSTTIRFSLPTAQTVSLKVYDLLGREVASLLNNERKAAGSYEATFNATALTSGIYIYRLEAGSFSQTRKMMLVK